MTLIMLDYLLCVPLPSSEIFLISLFRSLGSINMVYSHVSLVNFMATSLALHSDDFRSPGAFLLPHVWRLASRS
jgi:hypothetical protein